MDDTKKSQIIRFVNNESMADAVREVMTKSFLKPSKSTDVHFLAAKTIAIDLLEDAFKELNHFKKVEREPINKLINQGL